MLQSSTIAMSCRVQFDRRELGVELVKDVDVMPIDPTDNLPSIFGPMMVRLPELFFLVLPGSLPILPERNSKSLQHGIPLYCR